MFGGRNDGPDIGRPLRPSLGAVGSKPSLLNKPNLHPTRLSKNSNLEAPVMGRNQDSEAPRERGLTFGKITETDPFGAKKPDGSKPLMAIRKPSKPKYVPPSQRLSSDPYANNPLSLAPLNQGPAHQRSLEAM